MKRVTAFVGSARRRHTYQAVRQFTANLETLGEIEASDGVVFATPNYSFQLSGLMKNLLDRIGFLFHRPRFFGKVSTVIVAQGIYGGRKIERYLDFVGNGPGFSTVKGSCLRTTDPVTRKHSERSTALSRSTADASGNA